MSSSRTTRRKFLQRSAAAMAGTTMTGTAMVPYISTAAAEQATGKKSKNDRYRIGAIGMRYQGSVITRKAVAHGDVVAIADVDRLIGEKAVEEFGGVLYEDYRRLLDRKDIDVLMIGTPEHWHTKILIDACRAGKDVYCEKPLTLTVDEGKQICKVVRETGRVVQVGTWQRSDERFRLACEMVHAGRIGELKKVTVVLDKNKTSGSLKTKPVPPHLNWDLWQGQTPDVPYIPERCHYTFRWWYEYSGGQMTDWGAHHIDIAQWAIGADGSGPVEIEATAKYPNVPNGYNVATDYWARYVFADGVELEVLDHGRGGLMLEGTKGRIFVNRGSLEGKAVEQLAEEPLTRQEFVLYDHDNHARPRRAGKLDSIINHMGNFFDCVETREMPISSVFNQHRSVSVCHLGNIAMRVGRKLKWDPEKEQFVGDDEANRMLTRSERKPYQIEA